MNKFNSIKIGDAAEIKHTITQSDIEKFVELTGDDNKLDVDEGYASTTSFKKPIAHGMLGASFISTVIGTKLPGDGALWYAQNLELLQPVRIGDELRITAEVKKIDPTNTIELQTDIFNQHKQKITKSQKTVLIIGGTGGIGSAVCIQLAKDRFDVSLHYYKNKADKLKKQIEKIGRKAVVVSGDIVSLKDLLEIKEKTMRAFGNISVITNCSTITIPNFKFSDLEWE